MDGLQSVIISVLAESLQQVMEHIGTIVETMWEACWDAYRAAGMPYADSKDGMMRWVRECAEAARLVRDAHRILERHRDLAQFRQLLAERDTDHAQTG